MPKHVFENSCPFSSIFIYIASITTIWLFVCEVRLYASQLHNVIIYLREMSVASSLRVYMLFMDRPDTRIVLKAHLTCQKKKNNEKINKDISLVNKGYIIIGFCYKIN